MLFQSQTWMDENWSQYYESGAGMWLIAVSDWFLLVFLVAAWNNKHTKRASLVPSALQLPLAAACLLPQAGLICAMNPVVHLQVSLNCNASDFIGLSWIQKLQRHVVMDNITRRTIQHLEDNNGFACHCLHQHYQSPSSSPIPMLQPKWELDFRQMNSRSVPGTALSLPLSKCSGESRRLPRLDLLCGFKRTKEKTWGD